MPYAKIKYPVLISPEDSQMKVADLKKQVEDNFESSKLEERDVESIRKSCHSTL